MARRGIVKVGHKQLQKVLQQYGYEVEKRVKEIILETTLLIHNHAKTLAPVDDGNLRDSIEFDILENGFTGYVRVGAEYAIYVEYGTGIYATGPGGSSAKKIPWVYYSEKLQRFVMTSGNPEQPFWFPAIRKGQRYFRKEMKRLG